jgi:hypothetical protein
MENVSREGQNLHYKKSASKKKIKALKKELKKLQDEKNTLLARKQSLLGQTVESLAELASFEKKLFHCARFLDESPVWATEEDFKKENNRYALGKLLQEAITFWSGLPQNILDSLPEDILQGATSEQSLEQPIGEQD